MRVSIAYSGCDSSKAIEPRCDGDVLTTTCFLLGVCHPCFSFPCSAWTSKLITAKDHASVQINIGHLNDEGAYNGQFTTFAIAGDVRAVVSISSVGCM
jgi:hypothetical protein